MAAALGLFECCLRNDAAARCTAATPSCCSYINIFNVGISSLSRLGLVFFFCNQGGRNRHRSTTDEANGWPGWSHIDACLPWWLAVAANSCSVQAAVKVCATVCTPNVLAEKGNRYVMFTAVDWQPWA